MKTTENYVGKKSFLDSLSRIQAEESEKILENIFSVQFFAIII